MAVTLVLAFGAASASAAGARAAARPRGQASVPALRALVHHYRHVTWVYQRAAHLRPTRPGAPVVPRTRDRRYLQWTVDSWSRRAYLARSRALDRIRRRLAVVGFPHPPRLHASLHARVVYSRRLALRLRRIYPGRGRPAQPAPRSAPGRRLLRLWQVRSARAALAVSRHVARGAPIPHWLTDTLLCIHAHEASWTANTGNGYYGGFQMDIVFQTRYGRDFASRWGTADNWPAWAQLQAAVRAYRAGRGFRPWPSSAPSCGV